MDTDNKSHGSEKDKDSLTIRVKKRKPRFQTREKVRRLKLQKLHKKFMRKIKEREECNVNVLEQTQTVLETDIEKALKLLEDTPENKTNVDKSCSEVILKKILPHVVDNEICLWYLPTYIPQLMRISILKHDWDTVTSLLLMLVEHKPIYLPHIKKAAFATFLKNSADSDAKLLDEFLEFCFVTTKKDVPAFDICYKETS